MGDILTDMKKSHDYLVCIDSDGCLFDNMELKHKECFCPATVNVWELQGVSKYAREAAEFVNLYSRTRGFNRFPALIRTLELTYARPEVQARGYHLPDLEPLKRWIQETPVLSAAEIERLAQSGTPLAPVVMQAARWSREVDENIKRIVRHVPPFPYAKDAMAKLGTFADVIIVSATPHEALVRELTEHGIDKLVNVIAGQELGTKTECIRKAMQGRYDAQHVLKIGDAPSDKAAADANGVMFRPIIPGKETESWKDILDESADRFRDGTYRGAYMDHLVEQFLAALLEDPPWIQS